MYITWKKTTTNSPVLSCFYFSWRERKQPEEFQSMKCSALNQISFKGLLTWANVGNVWSGGTGFLNEKVKVMYNITREKIVVEYGTAVRQGSSLSFSALRRAPGWPWASRSTSCFPLWGGNGSVPVIDCLCISGTNSVTMSCFDSPLTVWKPDRNSLCVLYWSYPNKPSSH